MKTSSGMSAAKAMVFVVWAGAMSACGGGSSDGGSGGTNGSSAFRCVAACAAVTDAEATGLLGGLDNPGGTAGVCVKAADATNSSCQWHYAPASTDATLHLEVSSESNDTFDLMRKTQQASPGYQDIPGVGDAAFKSTLGVGSGQAAIIFRVGDLTFQLVYTDISQPTPADIDQKLQTEALAMVGRVASL